MTLWESGGKVRNVTHTLPLHTRHAIKPLFRLVLFQGVVCFAMWLVMLKLLS